MLQKFKTNIAQNNLSSKKEKILLAVSGGIDSSVMAHLFVSAGYSIGIAHCNFGLRGKESDEDEVFVKRMAKKYKSEFHFIRFETEKYAGERQLSVQMAARELRYQWFEKIRTEFGYDKIAIAHNRNDIIETFFINLTRGTGIRGLTGIEPVKGKIIRPLLFVSRNEIEAYSKKHGIVFREDSSNQCDKYQRNSIRHHVIPALIEINPSFEENFFRSLDNLKQARTIYTAYIDKVLKEITSEKNGQTEIDLKKLQNNSDKRAILFELISKYGFNNKILDNILNSLESHSGKQFFSDNYTLTRDRSKLIISETEPENFTHHNLNQGINKIAGVGTIKISPVKTRNFKSKNKGIIFVDGSLVEFPLTLRFWQKGDYFVPFGMTGNKKLSDFFNDQKVPRPVKNKIPLLLSGDKIVWVVGYRADNRFRADQGASKVFKVELFDK